MLSVSIFSLSYFASVYADTDLCYDEVGDGHNCYEKEKICEMAQKHDEIAESPCYKE
ncbi:MAG TPA: hypothetical protein VNB67_00875 [Nitrososphaeraceae archaeon]|nr:hypothetical protein [Nitrososphaeraceae archaeon]